MVCVFTAPEARPGPVMQNDASPSVQPAAATVTAAGGAAGAGAPRAEAGGGPPTAAASARAGVAGAQLPSDGGSGGAQRWLDAGVITFGSTLGEVLQMVSALSGIWHTAETPGRNLLAMALSVAGESDTFLTARVRVPHDALSLSCVICHKACISSGRPLLSGDALTWRCPSRMLDQPQLLAVRMQDHRPLQLSRPSCGHMRFHTCGCAWGRCAPWTKLADDEQM